MQSRPSITKATGREYNANMKPFGLIALLVVASIGVANSFKTITASKPGFFNAKATYAVLDNSILGKFATSTLEAEAKQAVAQFKRESSSMDKPRYPYSYQQTNDVVYASSTVISVRTQIFWDTAGAHPNTNYTTLNFAMVNGKPKRIGLQDLLKEGVRGYWVDDLVIASLRNQNAYSVVEDGVAGLNQQQRDRFTISKRGLQFIFPPYDMGYYAQGTFDVDLTWSQLSPFVDPNGILKGLVH